MGTTFNAKLQHVGSWKPPLRFNEKSNTTLSTSSTETSATGFLPPETSSNEPPRTPQMISNEPPQTPQMSSNEPPPEFSIPQTTSNEPPQEFSNPQTSSNEPPQEFSKPQTSSYEPPSIPRTSPNETPTMSFYGKYGAYIHVAVGMVGFFVAKKIFSAPRR